MKKILMMLSLILLSCFFLTSCGEKKLTLEDFEYETLTNGQQELKKYIGKATRIKIVDIPGAYYTHDTFSFNEKITNVVSKVDIQEYMFEGCKNLKSVKVNGSIYDYAFKGCEDLEKINVHGSASVISPLAFLDCHKLTTTKMHGGSFSCYNREKGKMIYTMKNVDYYNFIVTLGTDTIYEDYPHIGEYAYYGRDALKEIYLPATIRTIMKKAFSNCDNLTRISVDPASPYFDSREQCNAIIEKETDKLVVTCKNTIVPKDVKIIGAYAFADSDFLEVINISARVKEIEQFAYEGCKNIKSISVDVNNIVYDSRQDCNAIIETETNKLVLACKNTVIPNTVKTIGSYSFADANIEHIVIPEGVTTIEDYAFAGNENIKSITIPSTVTSIGDKAFEGCSNIEIVKIAEGNAKYDSRENCNGIIDKTTSTLIKTFKNTTIPSTITTIGAYAFANNTSLTKINLPNNITTVENNAFENCVNVTTLELSENLKSIGYQAFKGLAIESLNIPMSVNNISVRAFEGCKDLFIVKVDAKNETYASYHNNGIVEKSTNALIMGTSETELDSSLSTVKQFAFYGSNIKSITVPANMTSLEAGAFAGCEKLVSLKVESGNSVYEDRGLNAVIEKSTNTIVAGCNMTSFDKSIKRIGAYAFAGSGIKGSTIGYLPNSITEICEYAFAYCNGGGTINVAKATEIIGAHAFKDSNFYIYFMWRMKPGEQFHEDWNSSNCYTNIS